MLATAAIVEAVAAAIASLELPRVVVDPVMIAKGGARLLEDEAIDAMRAELLPRAYVVTPNALEAAVIAGIEVTTLDDAREAAKRIVALGPAAAIVKGGHLKTDAAIDILFDGRQIIELRAARIETRHTHGTGCTFAAAIAANLALGLPLATAATRAKTYLTEAIRRAPGIGAGHGPLGHFPDRQI
jgi:hydroxymethylpyrimidine/phosphomethylpyrimidine kinase